MTYLPPTQNLRTKIRHIDVAVDVRHVGARRPDQPCPTPRVFSSQNACITLFCRLQLAMPLAAEESVSKTKCEFQLVSTDALRVHGLTDSVGHTVIFNLNTGTVCVVADSSSHACISMSIHTW